MNQLGKPTLPKQTSKRVVWFSVALVAVTTLVGRLAGFLRYLLQSWVLGATDLASVYASANAIPNILFELLAGGAIAAVLVPVFAQSIGNKIFKDLGSDIAPSDSSESGNLGKLGRAVATWALLIGCLVALLLYLLSWPIANFLTVGALSSEINLSEKIAILHTTQHFLQIFAWQIPLYALATVASAILQSHHKFWWPAVSPLLSSLTVMGTYIWVGKVLSGRIPLISESGSNVVSILAWGTNLGVVMLSVPQALVAMRLVGWRPTLKLDMRITRRIFRLAKVAFITLAAQQACVIATILGANWLGGAGAFNVFQYAQAVYLLPVAVIALPLVTVYAPRIAQADMPAGLIFESTKEVFQVAALGVGLIVAGAPTITAIFALKGNLPGLELGIYALSIAVLGNGLTAHFMRSLYALQQERKAAMAVFKGAVFTLILLIGLSALLILGKNYFAAEIQAWVGTFSQGKEADFWVKSTLITLALATSGGQIATAYLLGRELKGIIRLQNIEMSRSNIEDLRNRCSAYCYFGGLVFWMLLAGCLANIAARQVILGFALHNSSWVIAMVFLQGLVALAVFSCLTLPWLRKMLKKNVWEKKNAA